MLHRALTLCSLFWFGVPLDDSEYRGITIELKTSTLKFASDYAAKYLLADYIHGSMGDARQSRGCIFGNCSIRSFLVSDYVAPVSKVTVTPGINIQWQLENGQISLHFDFEIKKDEVDNVSGYAVVQLSGLSLAAEITVDTGLDGKLNITLIGCLADAPVSYSNVTITTREGNSERFLDLVSRELDGYLRNRVNHSVSTALCRFAGYVSRVIPDGLRQLNEYLASSVGFVINDNLTLTDPRVDVDDIEVNFDGRFRLVDNVGGFEIGSYNQPFSYSTAMVAVYIYEHVTRSLCNVLFEKDLLQINITKDSLIGLPLNYGRYGDLFDTTCDNPLCFGRLFPEIAQNRPNASVKIAIRASSPPSYYFYGNSFVLDFNFNVDVLITEEDGSEETVAKLSVYIRMALTAFVFNERIVGAIYVQKMNVTDNGSPKEFAPYVARFSSVIQAIVDLVLVPRINQYGALGIPLRYSQLRAVNANIDLNSRRFRWGNGASLFETDFVYDSNPSSVDDISLYNQHLSSLQQVW